MPRPVVNKNTVALKETMRLAFIAFLFMSYNAVGVTGSGDSPPTFLETVSPRLQSAEAVSDNRVAATFSESLITAGATIPGNYTVSGQGALEASPSEISGGPASFILDWNSGEMRDGAPHTLTVSGVQDTRGNLIRPDANSASFNGKGTAPLFTDLVVMPPQATAGNTVILKFSVSEVLKGAPEVTIMDSRVDFVREEVNNSYTYQYVVKRGDTPGMATIQLSGEDLAGNTGTFLDDSSLEIIASPLGMPFSWLPVAVLVLVSGALVCRRLGRERSRSSSKLRHLFLILIGLQALVGTVAVAQAPAVTNVTMTQRPNGVLGTRVDLYYDLTASAPCDIVLSLSKDNGTDGYAHAVIRYSGDIANVEPGTGRYIVWDIRADYPEETIPEASIRVTADDENIEHTLVYLAGEHGSVTGTTTQTLNHGEDAEAMTAVPDEGYHFAGWSDGVLTATRQDTVVTASRTLTAVFAINTYTITCEVSGSGSCTAAPAVVNHGDTSNIAVTPAAGWYIDSVVDSEEGPKSGSYTTTPVTTDRTVTAAFATGLVIDSFSINAGADTTENILVTLDNSCTGNPAEYLASESPSFEGASWHPYATSPTFRLSIGVGPRTVYFKVRNGGGESSAVSDIIFLEPELVPVAAGTFDMGRTDTGDDAFYGSYSEQPIHTVTLDAYEIAKYQTTNKQFCDVLNWSLSQGYLQTFNGLPWTGAGDIYGGGDLQILVAMLEPECNIQFSDGSFRPKTRTGLPDATVYSMENHPMIRTSWYGHAAFCNWLSEWQGYTPCYDMDSSNWPLATPPPQSGGYRLPTEAEWERAAAWDAGRHWIYSYTSDILDGARCNYGNHPYGPYTNPLGLTELAYTSPVGWFDGVNISPNGNIPTIDSPSPVGAYDMSGNVWEWCQDWYSSTYYSGGSMTNPTGPATGATKLFRGGAFRDAQNCRSACRDSRAPDKTPYWRGGRIARTP